MSRPLFINLVIQKFLVRSLIRLLDPAAVGTAVEETLRSLARPAIGGRGAGWGGDYSASPCHTKYFYYLHLS